MIMAHYAKHTCLLLLLVLPSTLNTEARESKFFSKTTHDTKDNRETVLAGTVLAPASAPAPETEPSIFGEGYGLYGHIPDDKLNYMKTKKNSQNYNPEQTKQPYNKKDNKYENSDYLTKEYKNDNYENGNYGDSYDDHGYVNGKFGQSDTRFSQDDENIKNMNNYNAYGAESGHGREREGYYGNNKNVFDTMEEYEKQQGYPEIQGEYYNP